METAETPGRSLLSIPQAAEVVGVSRTHMWRLVRDGVVPAVRVGDSRGPVRIAQPELERALVPYRAGEGNRDGA